MLISAQNNNLLYKNQKDFINKVEKKPVPKNKESFRNVNQNLNILKKQFNKNLDNLVKIVSDNIVYTFFNVDSEQITKLVTDFINWPIVDIVKNFVVYYYIPHKNDNILKMFVLYNINKIVNTAADIIEINLIKNSGLINFNHDAFEDQIKLLQAQLEDKTKVLNDRLGELKQQINQQYDGDINDITVDDDLNVTIINKQDNPKQAENELRDNVQSSILQQYNKSLQDQGLSSLMINTENRPDDKVLDLDQIKDNQEKEKQFRQTVRDKILKQLGFDDIVLGD